MNGKFYLIIAGRSKKSQTYVCLIEAMSAREAHDRAAEEYRAEHGLPSNIHISTHTVFESVKESEVQAFAGRLITKMEEQGVLPR